MSIDSRRRRSKKRAKRSANRPPRSAPRTHRDPAPPSPPADLEAGRVNVMTLVFVAVDLLVANPEDAERFADALVVNAGPQMDWLGPRLGSAVDLLVHWRTADGWTPADLARVVRRRADTRAEAVVVAALRRQADDAGPTGVAGEWQAELDDLPQGADPDPSTADGLRDVLLVLAALRGLPPLPRVVPAPRRPRHSRRASPDAWSC